MTRFTAASLEDLGALLAETARREIMPRFRRRNEIEIRHKTGPLDPVTEADLATEAVLTAALTTRYPGCTVIGEEAASADPAILAHTGTADLAFVLDPLDGTANFAAGVPVFGTMLAAIRRGEIIASAIHDPFTGETAYALRGEGAWIAGPHGRRDLRVATPDTPANMTGTVSWRYFPSPRRETICRNLARLGANWDYRCAAQQYRLAASGHCHFLLFHRLMPWDHAPGWLLHREAGGYAAHLDRSPYHPANITGGMLVAPDKASWEALHETLLAP